MLVILIISALFTLAYCVFHAYVFFGWNIKPAQKSIIRVECKVSVIVCARNEEAEIGQCLQSIIRADCSEVIECIVVNDASNDNTEQAILSVMTLYPKIKLINLQERKTNHPKRDALIAAAQSAKGDLLVFTDADCYIPPAWVSLMVDAYRRGNDFISGPVVYKKQAGWFKRIQALHYMTLQGLGGASFLVNEPILCSGANLGISKEVFFDLVNSQSRVSGAGEDMWLLERFRKLQKGNSFFLKNKDATVVTKAENSLKGFLMQQQRWAFKNKRYSDMVINLAMTIISGHFIFLLISLVLSCFYGKFATLIGFQIILQFTVDLICWMSFAIFFERKKLMWNFLPLQILRLPFYLLIGCSILINRFSWKGRALK